MERITLLEGTIRNCGDVTQISDSKSSPGRRALGCLTEMTGTRDRQGQHGAGKSGGARLWACRVQGIRRVSL